MGTRTLRAVGRFVVTLVWTLIATALLFVVLWLPVAAIDETPAGILRSHSRSSDTWPVHAAGKPPPTPEDMHHHAFQWCRDAGVEGVAQEFYTPPTAVLAAHEYAEQGTTESLYMEAAYGGCLAGLIAASSSE